MHKKVFLTLLFLGIFFLIDPQNLWGMAQSNGDIDISTNLSSGKALPVTLKSTTSKIDTKASDSIKSSFTDKPVTLRIYLLRPDIKIKDALKDKDDKENNIEYKNYPCKVNPSCTWYTKPKSLSTPKFWDLVEEGAGINLKQIDDDNTNEHWLYYVKTNGKKFGVIFGKGNFFKQKQYEFNEKDQEFQEKQKSDKKEKFQYHYSGINDQYGVKNFGYKVVQNFVEEPEICSKMKGTIKGTPYNNFCFKIQGLDYCSVDKCCDVKDIPSLCEKLYGYFTGGSRQVLDELRKQATEKEEVLIEVTNEVTKYLDQPSQQNTKKHQAEGKEIEYKIKSKKKVATKIFGKYWTFEGLKDYCDRTDREVRNLIQDNVIDLPKYQEESLKPKEGKPDHVGGTGDDSDDQEKRKTAKVDWEGLYNEYAAGTNSLTLLDKKCVEQVEICDLFDASNKILVHVKIGTKSSNLNHLFGQGRASAVLLKNQEYRKKIPIEIVRRHIYQETRRLIESKYKEEKTEIETIFNKWREEFRPTLKGLTHDQQSEKNRKLLEILETMIYSDEKKEAIDQLRKFCQQIHEEDRDTFIKGIDQLSEQQLSLKKYKEVIEDEIKKLNKKLHSNLSSDEKLIIEYKDFSQPTKNLFDLHIALKKLGAIPQFEGNETLKKLVELLDPYRADLLEGAIKSCCDIVQQSDPKTYNEFCTKMLSEYDQKKTERITKDELEKLLKNEEIKKEFDDLYMAFNHNNNNKPLEFKIVYGIITDKKLDTKGLIPLGARINLLSNVAELKNSDEAETSIKYDVAVKIIPDVSNKSEKKTILKTSSKKADSQGNLQKNSPKKTRAGKTTQPKKPAAKKAKKEPDIKQKNQIEKEKKASQLQEKSPRKRGVEEVALPNNEPRKKQKETDLGDKNNSTSNET